MPCGKKLCDRVQDEDILTLVKTLHRAQRGNNRVFAIVKWVDTGSSTGHDTPFGKRRHAMQSAMLVGKRTPIGTAHIRSLPHDNASKPTISCHF